MYLLSTLPSSSSSPLFLSSEIDQQHHLHGSPLNSTQQHNTVFDTPSRSPNRSRIRDFTPTPYVPQNTPTTTMNSPYNGYGSPSSGGYGTPGDPPVPMWWYMPLMIVFLHCFVVGMDIYLIHTFQPLTYPPFLYKSLSLIPPPSHKW